MRVIILHNEELVVVTYRLKESKGFILYENVLDSIYHFVNNYFILNVNMKRLIYSFDFVTVYFLSFKCPFSTNMDIELRLKVLNLHLA